MSNFAHIKTIRACDDGTTRACDDGLIRTCDDGLIRACDDGTNPSSSTPGKKDQPQIFRFKITDDIMKLLFQFAKIHQHDDRKSYKEFRAILMPCQSVFQSFFLYCASLINKKKVNKSNASLALG